MSHVPQLNLTNDELLSTTRAVRKRLDFERPVPREVVEECAQLAFQAPSGSNRQHWHFVVVGDPVKKKAIADLYGTAFDTYINTPGTDYGVGDTRTERQDAVRTSAMYLRENLHRAPWLVIACMEGRFEKLPLASQPGQWGSLFPAFWSFMLAARARGLGTVWTTLHLRHEQAAAEILGIPYDRITQGAMTPLAYTIGTEFKAAPRLETSKVLHWDGW